METKFSRVMIIACGSFSPITPMHLRMFEIAKDHFEKNEIFNVVGGIISPTHDTYAKQGLISAKHRCAMIKLATRTSDWIRLSDWEVKQKEWSRTRSVIETHKNIINNYLNINDNNDTINLPEWIPQDIKDSKQEVHIKLLCGADLLESFSTPGLWAEEDIEAIVGNHGIVVISRSGSNPERFIFESDILTKYRKNITLITNWVPNEISSSVIRRLMSRNESVKYLIDDMIIEYIKVNGLYQSTNSSTSLTKINNHDKTNNNAINNCNNNKTKKKRKRAYD